MYQPFGLGTSFITQVVYAHFLCVIILHEEDKCPGLRWQFKRFDVRGGKSAKGGDGGAGGGGGIFNKLTLHEVFSNV